MSHRRVLERSPSPDRSAYWPMEPLDPDTSLWGRGMPCVIHSWGCTGPRVLTIEPGGGGKRRKRGLALHHSGHQPCRGIGDSSDGAHLYWSTGSTSRATGTTDRDHIVSSLTLLTLVAPPSSSLTLPSLEASLSGFCDVLSLSKDDYS
jgi:hypothetical protein